MGIGDGVVLVVAAAGIAFVGACVSGLPDVFGQVFGAMFNGGWHEPGPPHGTQEDDDFRWSWRSPRDDDRRARRTGPSRAGSDGHDEPPPDAPHGDGLVVPAAKVRYAVHLPDRRA